ncbi:MAG: hypothetical protein CW338_02110 [Clostridiales bacterium]|nr:hypothetical protein [Clostridiales bacterium]
MTRRRLSLILQMRGRVIRERPGSGSSVKKMKIVFRSDDCSECWDGVFYKKLSRYPFITEWEARGRPGRG